MNEARWEHDTVKVVGRWVVSRARRDPYRSVSSLKTDRRTDSRTALDVVTNGIAGVRVTFLARGHKTFLET